MANNLVDKKLALVFGEPFNFLSITAEDVLEDFIGDLTKPSTSIVDGLASDTARIGIYGRYEFNIKLKANKPLAAIYMNQPIDNSDLDGVSVNYYGINENENMALKAIAITSVAPAGTSVNITIVCNRTENNNA